MIGLNAATTDKRAQIPSDGADWLEWFTRHFLRLRRLGNAERGNARIIHSESCIGIVPRHEEKINPLQVVVEVYQNASSTWTTLSLHHSLRL